MKTKLFVAMLVIVLLAAFVLPVKAEEVAPGSVVEISGILLSDPGYWVDDTGPHATMTVGIIEDNYGNYLTVGVLCSGDLAVRVHNNFQQGESVWVRGKVIELNAYPQLYTLKAWNAKVMP